MKIKKLEIHNLASIKDAEIDFETGHLSDAELFLITGTTGSGKTTLLDAISLALYNTTPRIAKGQNGKTEANEDNLTGKDPRNIMRQNTGYAYSKLWFEGNDRTNYLAEWSVSRGKHFKVNVSMSNELWSITNLDTGVCTSGQKDADYKEVSRIITDAVGLDFNQFCRTTMLAQGEFTEFLKSDESAKAEILEKISGTEVYRKIGIEIHKQYNQIKKELDEAKSKHDLITPLPEAERKELEEELAQIEAKVEELSIKADTLQKCITWLESEASLKAKVENAAKRLTEAEAVITSSEFIQKKNTSEQWKATVEVREALSNARRHKANADIAAGRLAALEQEFREALAGEAYETEALNKTLHALEEIEKTVKTHAQYASIYENEQTIIADVKSWKDESDTLVKAKADYRKKEETDFPAAQAALIKAERHLEAAEGAEEQSMALLHEANNQLAALKLPELRKEKEFLTSVKATKATIDGHRHDIAKATESIAATESQLAGIKAAEAAEKAELTRLEEEHKRRKQTIDKFAKEMRTVLHTGLGKSDNLCPVCGQVVTELKTDVLLDEEYEKIHKEFAEQEKKAKEATAEVNRLESLLKVTRESLSGFTKRLATEVDGLTRELEGRPDAQTLNEASAETIAAMITELQEKIEKGEKIEKKKEDLAKAHTECLKKKGEATNDRTQCLAAVELIRKEISALNTKIMETEGKKMSLTQKINEAINISHPWNMDWHNNPEGFTTDLKDMAAQYRKAVESSGKYSAYADQIRVILKFIAKIKEEIMEAMPGWSTEGVVPKSKKDLQNFWATLKSKVDTELSAIGSERESHKNYAQQVKGYLDGHQEYSIETLEYLMTISSDAHLKEESYVNGKVTEHTTAAEACKNAKDELAEHLGHRPDPLKPEDTQDSLKEVKVSVEKLRDERNTRKGEIQNKLEKDDEDLRKKGDRTLIDQLEEEHKHWKSFHDLFGDSNGNTLSRAAQSYVLESLLANANRHLKTMAPRYRLLVNPGTLNLKLEDKYNDYQTRSTNSISGGESFLVSLALALALADFGQHLGVSMLFIDEGFGTLSGEALQSAINTLKSLHTDSGRQVGIISHREEIRHSIPVQICVNLTPGTSASTVEVMLATT